MSKAILFAKTMSRLIYCDTNVYIDYFLDRRDRLRPLGELAQSLFRRTFDCEFSIVVSDLILLELKNQGCIPSAYSLMNQLYLCGKLMLVEAVKDDKIIAQKLDAHFSDAMHAAIAHRAGATCIVTMNMKDFAQIRSFIQSAEPNGI
jgi:predicted nucleic acid-binding protein